MIGRPHECERCGTEYTDRWPRCDKKYCTNKCRQAAYRERKWKAMIAARDQARAHADADRKKKAQAKSKRIDARLKKPLKTKPKKKRRRVT